MSLRGPLFAIFLTVFIDLVGFGLILPLLPFYAETVGASPAGVGFLVASYALAQLVGAPILGRLSDEYGRRPILLLSIFGTSFGFLILGFAQELAPVFGSALAAMYASRIVSGLTGGNISVAQAYITDVTDERTRTQGLGMIGAAFGLGFIIGPAIGGFLSGWGFNIPAFAASGLAAVNLLLVFFRLPESLTPERRAALAGLMRPPFTFGAMLSALSRPLVGPLLQIRFFFGLAFVTFQAVFALFAQYRLGLSPQMTAFVLSYVGLLSVLVQAFAIGRLTRRFSEARLIVASVGLMSLAMLGWAFTPSLIVLFVVLAPMSLAGGILNTVLNSALTKTVEPQEIGGILGIGASVESMTRVIAPSVGGLLFGSVGAWGPGVFAAIVLGILLPYAYRTLLHPNSPLSFLNIIQSNPWREPRPDPAAD